MHTEKQEIFDKYARSQKFGDWDHLLNDFECKLMTVDEFQYFVFEACDIVQQEQQNRIVENVMMKNHDGTSKKNRHITYFQNGSDNIQIDKDTITNPKNIIS